MAPSVNVAYRKVVDTPHLDSDDSDFFISASACFFAAFHDYSSFLDLMVTLVSSQNMESRKERSVGRSTRNPVALVLKLTKPKLATSMIGREATRSSARVLVSFAVFVRVLVVSPRSHLNVESSKRRTIAQPNESPDHTKNQGPVSTPRGSG